MLGFLARPAFDPKFGPYEANRRFRVMPVTPMILVGSHLPVNPACQTVNSVAAIAGRDHGLESQVDRDDSFLTATVRVQTHFSHWIRDLTDVMTQSLGAEARFASYEATLGRSVASGPGDGTGTGDLDGSPP
jgi:hypothetical protein